MSSFTKHIIYEEHKNLGESYNNVMTPPDGPNWRLLLDHDVFLATCKNWHAACEEAVNIVINAKIKDRNVGLITCRTNRVHMGPQLAKGAPKSDNILEHIEFAKKLWNFNGYLLKQVKPPLSGFFMLVNRQAWLDVDGFKEKGFEGIDYDFTERLHKKGWKLMMLDGVYVYHLWKQVKREGKLWQGW